jgi:nitroreductase
MDAVAMRLHVRKYTNQALGKESVRALLEAAMAAHSEGDQRPWHFVVIEDLATRTRIAEAHPGAHIVVQAPDVIVVCGDPTLQKHPGFWMQDCAAATENILIKAQAMGLGAMWFGIFPVEGRVQSIRKILDLPSSVIPFSLTTVGYPAEHNGWKCQYDPSRVHFDRW